MKIKRIVKVIFFLLSYSPVLCISDDENFGTNEKGIEDYKKRLRISLISIYFGAYKYYLISFSIKDNKLNFNIKYRIDLFSLNQFTNNDVTRVTTKQRNYLEYNTKFQEDKDFLIYLIGNQENRKNNSNNKINIYTTILLALIPMIIIFYNTEQFIKGNIITKALTIILFCIMANICILILQVSKVSEYRRERYADLKESDDKAKHLIMSYYLDYQHIKCEADRLVSFVKNIEIFIRGAIICTLLLTVSNYINDIKLKSDNDIKTTNIYQIDIRELEESDYDSVKVINEVNERIPNNNIEKVVILYDNDKILVDKSFCAIVDYFNIYRSKSGIILLKESDGVNDKIFKIILIGE